MKIGGSKVLVGFVVHGQGGTDVQQDDFVDGLGIVDTEFMSDSSATIVSTNVELRTSQFHHHVNAVFSHSALGIQLVVLVIGRLRGGPIASYINSYDSELAGKLWGNSMPDVVTLGEAVEEKERRS